MSASNVEAALNELRRYASKLNSRSDVTLYDVIRGILINTPSTVFLGTHKARALAHIVTTFERYLRPHGATTPYDILKGRALSRLKSEVAAREIDDYIVVSVTVEPPDGIRRYSDYFTFNIRDTLIQNYFLRIYNIENVCIKRGNIDNSYLFDAIDSIALDEKHIDETLLENHFRLPYHIQVPISVAMIIGRDDSTGKLFIHMLPQPLSGFTHILMRRDKLNNRILRSLMGFDFQPWEIHGYIAPGVKVRVQGDLVAEILEYCSGNDECKLKTLPAVLEILQRSELIIDKINSIISKIKNLNCSSSNLFYKIFGEYGKINKLAKVPSYFFNEYINPQTLRYLTHVAIWRLLQNGYLDNAFTIKLDKCEVEFKFIAVYPPYSNIESYLAMRDDDIVSLRDIIHAITNNVSVGVKMIIRWDNGEEKALEFIDIDDEHNYEYTATQNVYMQALLESLMSVIARAAIDESLRISRFQAIIDDSHVISGKGIAGSDILVPTNMVILPKARENLDKLVCRYIESETADGKILALAEISSALLYYGRAGDLYVYTDDGELLFSHPEHGDVIVSLDAPAVVRVTSLNSAPRPPDELVDEFQRLLDGEE